MTRGEPWARIGELAGTCADAAGAIAVLPDGTRLMIGHADGTVRCVDLATGETVWVGGERHEPVLQALACSPDGRLVATAAEDRVVRIWDGSTGAVVGRHAHAPPSSRCASPPAVSGWRPRAPMTPSACTGWTPGSG